MGRGGDRGNFNGGGNRDRGGDRGRDRDRDRGDDRDNRGQQGGGGGQRIQRDQDRGDRDHGNPKRMKMQDKMMHPDQRIMERIRSINQNDVVAKKFEVKKFTANTRLYIGNISNDVTEDDLKEIFKPFGELDELFLNRDKNFAFLKLDYRTSAEKARSELDGHNLKGRQLRVRFAPACVRLKVKNLAPTVSNELLEIAFSVFGEVERALVFVDDKGKSIGEGIVDFTRKNFALAANQFCAQRCYFLSTELRPVETELGEMYEMDEGLLEANLTSRQGGNFNKGHQRQEQSFHQSRELGPRVADEGSFEHEYGLQWKKMMGAFREKEAELKQQLEVELDNLYKKMELAKYDYETEMLRRQLKQREMDQERARMEYEQRMQRNQGGSRPGYVTMNRQGMDQGDRFDFDQDRGQNQRGNFQAMMGGANMVLGMDIGNIGMQMQDAPPMDNQINQETRPDDDGMVNPLAPPPMPPQGLMDLETGIEIGSADAGQQQGVTWELGPFSGNFGNSSDTQQNEGGPSPGFGGTQKIYRDRPSRFSDGGNNEGGSGRGGGSHNRGRGNFRGGHNSGRIPRR